MKRILSLLLSLLLLSLTVVPALPAASAANVAYGSVPILLGDDETDYLVDELLKEIFAGKNLSAMTTAEKVCTVYDWIIYHCTRYDYQWDGTYYFDPDEVAEKAVAYGEQARARVKAHQAVIRPQPCDYLDLTEEESRGDGWDSNGTIAGAAWGMMYTRNGDCVHFSSLFAALLCHLGIDSHLIAGDFVNLDGSVVIHKWNYCLIDGQFVWFDIRIDHSITTNYHYLSHQYYWKTDTAAWAKEHIWSRPYTDRLATDAGKIKAYYELLLNHDHEIAWTEGYAAGCETYGMADHYECTVCRTCFTDETGETQIPRWRFELWPLGHDWGDWEWIEEATWEHSGVRQCVCQRDASHVKTEKVRALGNKFEDVPAGAYYETPVVWALDKEITNGTSEYLFSPDAKCTRAHVVTFLWRGAGRPEAAAEDENDEGEPISFTDVPADTWYTDAVLWAVENGVTNGTGPTTFSPNQTCTRGQVVTFLWRAAGSPAVEDVENPFTDVAEDAYYYVPVLWAVSKGITNGTSETTFSPNRGCTRGQVVTFLYRATEK